MRASLVTVDSADRDELIARLTGTVAELARRDVRGAGNAEADVFGRILCRLERIARDTRDLQVLHAISEIEQQHGISLRSAEEIAARIGANVASVQRVLAHIEARNRLGQNPIE